MRYLKDPGYLISLLEGALLIIVGVAFQAYAVAFATENVSNSVTDLVLSNTPVYAVDGFFVYGAVVLTLFLFFVLLAHPARAPFVLKTGALFLAVRSCFVSLTHISPFPHQVAITPNIITETFPSFFTGSDLFFSGHVGVPFLFALIFWDSLPLRLTFLGFSILFAFVVLFGHIHYSIDVASAFFITFTIFALAKHFFKTDWLRSSATPVL